MKNKKKLWQPINLADLLYTATERFSDNIALKFKVGHHYENLTYFELKQAAIKLAVALKQFGLKPQDKVIIFSENRPEWVITDLALITLGVINVPIHSVLSSVQLENIIKEIRPKAIFFSNHDLGLKLLEISKTISKIPHLISFEKIETSNFEKLHYFKELVDASLILEKNEAELIEASLKIKPEAVTTIIYTSGTTGHFKGVQLTHENLIFDCLGVLGNVQVYPEDRFFSVLPLSHVFERTIGYYIPLYSGASIGYATDLAKLSQEIKERQPTIVIAVPRLFEKIYEKILEKVSKKMIKKIIFRFAFGIKKNNRHKKLEKMFERLVFSKVQAEFGGQIRFFVSGGAALSPKLGKFFEQVGLIILEGYGLTETSPVISCNRLVDYSFGTVGPVLEGVDVKISPAGEVMVKGPNVSPGYVRKTDSAEAFTKDGWFKTGDYGYFDRKGFLVLTGRKKDLIVLSTGKKVAPAIIETQLESSLYIDQAFVFGDAKKHIGAIIVPSHQGIEKIFGKTEGHRMAKNEKIREFLYEEIKSVLKNYASYEQVRKFVIRVEPFSVESGELTPKFGLRRHVIVERNLEEIEKLYQN